MYDNKFEKTNPNNYVFVKGYSSDDFIILLLYVNDMFVIESDLRKTKALKERFENEFIMKDLGVVRQILEMRITGDYKNRKF
jgi:Reverse transcriptase (RNA-dependent DNA polymerase)